MNSKKLTHIKKAYVRHTALAVAVAMGFGVSGQVLAQATTGSIFGTAPVSSGETIRVVNNQTGLTREVAVGSDGRYGANQLAVGDYTVSLVQNGSVVATREHVQVSVAGGTAVAFAAAEKNVQSLSGVTVTANALPAIDVSSTRQTSVITAEQLKTLPVAHSAEAIALLAPGVNLGGSTLGNGPTGTPLVSMGGNSVVENAYYLNGFNTTDPIGGAGGVALPFFAIAEQQTITSGYGPEYGRSTGGVISQIGQRGSNEFHAGVYVSVRPSFAQGNFDNVHYNNPLTPVGAVDNGYIPPANGLPASPTNPGTFGPGNPIVAPSQGTTAYAPGYGKIQTGKKQNSNSETVYDAYLSGPLIKDKLFFFITAEWQHDSAQGGLQNFGVTSPQGFWQSTANKSPKMYGKLDWNINDSNILELTGVQTQNQETTSNFYNYDYTNQKVGSFYGPGVTTKDTFKIGILKYTSYITDSLTLEASYGVMTGQYFSGLAGANVAPVSFGNVPVPPGVTVPNLVDTTIGNPGHKTKTENLRVDLDWKITADHDIKFGIDNVQYRDDDDGTSILGGGAYSYVQGDPATFAANTPFIANPGYGNYVVESLVQQNVTIAARQKAQYVEDRWQVTPNLLLDLGLRNDQFENTGFGKAYVKETSPQWAPRLGFSWDVMGDGTLKVFGNAGRYYLALPAGLAARNSAFGSINGAIVSTYTGMTATGVPTGTTPLLVQPIPGLSLPPGYFSADGENGVPGNIKNYASTNLKPQYQDEYVLGFQKMLGDTGLVLGSQATFEKAGNLVDDTDVAIRDANGNLVNVIAGLVNPGKTNYIPQPGGPVTWNPTTGQGVYNGNSAFIPFPKPSRKYYALDTYLEHTWDGKWFGKIDYLFSKSYGSTEGPTDTAIGQITNQTNGGFSGSTTAQWDFPDLMAFANGEQANSHRHTIKAFGSYAFTPEWMVSGTFIMQSGAPNACLSGFGSTIYADAYNGPYQHYCGGVPQNMSTVLGYDSHTGVYGPVGYGGVGSPPGDSGHTPWTHMLNLSLTYTPDWAHKHLTLQAEMHNVLNEQKATLFYTQYAIGNGGGAGGGNSGTYQYNPVYHTAASTEAPRYMEFNAKYDF
jgi:hypothetical protein